jgi:nucleoid DNA-binding protein
MVSRRAERNGRNPRTGNAIRIPAKKVPRFKPSRSLKAAVL